MLGIELGAVAVPPKRPFYRVLAAILFGALIGHFWPATG